MDHEVSRGERASACHIPVQASQPEKRELGPYLAFYVHGSCEYHTRHLVCVGHPAEHRKLSCSKVPRGQQSYVLSLRDLHTQLRLVASSSEGSSIGCPSALKANRIIGGSEFPIRPGIQTPNPTLAAKFSLGEKAFSGGQPCSPEPTQWEQKTSKTLSSEHTAQPGTLQSSPPSSRAQGGNGD